MARRNQTCGPHVSALASRIANIIRATGPIDVGTYMNICLHDPAGGYYHTQPGLGRDFVTAPEISQVFGELLGLWAAHEWQQMGAPGRISLVEAGPGRGDLIADALRAAASVPGFVDAIDLYLVENSPVLQKLQRKRLAGYKPVFLPDLQSVPSGQPFVIVGNEWLDCLPARQFFKTGKTWHERQIGVAADDRLVFGLARENPPAQKGVHVTPKKIIEIQPGLETVVMAVQALLQQAPGRALFIDYGRSTTDGPADDTLRAWRNGQQVDPLAEPGKSDLSVDVDFVRLGQLAADAGLRVYGPASQARFLITLGIEARFEYLARSKPACRSELYAGMRRLVDPDEMGQRFHVMALANHESRNVAGF